jgi:hypothetical protein
MIVNKHGRVLHPQQLGRDFGVAGRGNAAPLDELACLDELIRADTIKHSRMRFPDWRLAHAMTFSSTKPPGTPIANQLTPSGCRRIDLGDDGGSLESRFIVQSIRHSSHESLMIVFKLSSFET